MAAAAKLKEEKDEKDGKKKKDKAEEKSLIVLDVKPWEADTDLAAVWKLIVAHEINGLTWGAKYELQPVAFGVKKIVMTCSIVSNALSLPVQSVRYRCANVLQSLRSSCGEVLQSFAFVCKHCAISL
jgi:translation elongation factor EF-1beta